MTEKDNIVSFMEAKKRQQNEGREIVILEWANVPEYCAAFSHQTQLALITQQLLHEYRKDPENFKALDIHRLVLLATAVLGNLQMPATMLCGVSVREYSKEPIATSVRLFGTPISRLGEVVDPNDPSLNSFVLDIAYDTLDHIDDVSGGIRVQADDLVIAPPSDAVISETAYRSLIANMNHLVEINGGCSFLSAEKNNFYALLPYSPKEYIGVMLQVDAHLTKKDKSAPNE